MSSNSEGANREESTDLNWMLLNLSELLKVRDERTAYLASAAIEQLASLRASAAHSGFVRWNLLNKTPLTAGSELASRYRSAMDVLVKLIDALRVAQVRRSLDTETAKAAARIQDAWEALEGPSAKPPESRLG